MMGRLIHACAAQVQDETVRTLVKAVNEAIAALKPWPLLPDQPLGRFG